MSLSRSQVLDKPRSCADCILKAVALDLGAKCQFTAAVPNKIDSLH